MSEENQNQENTAQSEPQAGSAQENVTGSGEQKSREQNKGTGFNGFLEKLRGIIDTGVEASKKGLSSAGNAISDFGDKSVLRIEITQLNSKAEKIYSEFGKYAADTLLKPENAALSKDDPKISAWLSELKELGEKITQREEALKPASAQ